MSRQSYIYGTAVRKPVYEPERREPRRRPSRQAHPDRQRRTTDHRRTADKRRAADRRARQTRQAYASKPVHRQAPRGRRKTKGVSAGYALFLLAAAMIVLLVCVSYIKVQVGVAGQKEKIGDLKTELSSMQDENDTHYNAIMDSVDMDQIKNRATNELGMGAASADQVISVDGYDNEYIEQYASDGEQMQESGQVASGTY